MNNLRLSLWSLFLAICVLSSSFADPAEEQVEESTTTEVLPTEALETPAPEPTEASGEVVTEAVKDVAPTDEETIETAKETLELPPRVIPAPPEGGWDVYVVPIKGPINSPQLFILRRALKEAISNDIEVIVLDMDTPGGDLGTTLEMMEALTNFEGETITFVDDEAVSAGSYISVATDDIWFAPTGIMGAAEAVSGSGEDINESMKRKIDSYLRAKVRVLGKDYRYRADVQRAMMDSSFVLEIDGHVIKAEGELLSLTAEEATKAYGEPPEPLLASGIADSLDDLLTQKYGEGNYNVRRFEITWSEEFAKWFKGISPILLGIGFLLIFIEMKTPNFGVIGVSGILMLLVVFASNYFAGMAGNEEILIFLLGVILLAVEIFILPGSMIFGLLGGGMIIGALLWAMADIWPNDDFEITPELFYIPVVKLLIGFIIAIVGMALLAKFLPNTWIWNKLVLGPANEKTGSIPLRDGTGNAYERSQVKLPEPGTHGIVVTTLRPSGLVEIDGHRFEAKTLFGSIDKGETVEVVKKGDFSIVVKKG